MSEINTANMFCGINVWRNEKKNEQHAMCQRRHVDYHCQYFFTFEIWKMPWKIGQVSSIFLDFILFKFKIREKIKMCSKLVTNCQFTFLIEFIMANSTKKYDSIIKSESISLSFDVRMNEWMVEWINAWMDECCAGTFYQHWL